MAALSRRAGRTKEADGFEYAAGLLPPDHQWANPFAAEVKDLYAAGLLLAGPPVGEPVRRGSKRPVAGPAAPNRYVAQEAAGGGFGPAEVEQRPGLYYQAKALRLTGSRKPRRPPRPASPAGRRIGKGI